MKVEEKDEPAELELSVKDQRDVDASVTRQSCQTHVGVYSGTSGGADLSPVGKAVTHQSIHNPRQYIYYKFQKENRDRPTSYFAGF